LLLSTYCGGIAVQALNLPIDSEDKTTLNYVSLGDSMSNGYGLSGYNGIAGVEDYGDASYANQLAKWLETKYAVPVNHSRLAMSAMRAEDLNWILRFDFRDESVKATEMKQWNKAEWRKAFPLTGDFWTWDWLCDDSRLAISAAYIEAYVHGNMTIRDILENPNNPLYDPEYKLCDEEVRSVAKYYQESVRDADVITMSIGNGNFGVFMSGLMMDALGALGGDPDATNDYDYHDVLQTFDGELQMKMEMVLSLIDDQAVEFLSENGFTEEQVLALSNVLKYTVLSFLVNYIGTIEAILTLNPDATIVLVSLMNTFSSPEEEETDEASICDLLDLVYGPLNTFIATLPAYKQAIGEETYRNAMFYYAEAEMVQCMVETFGQDFYDVNGKGTKFSNRNSVTRKRFVQDIVGTQKEPGLIWELLMEPQLLDGLTLMPVTFDEVCHYDDMTATQKAQYGFAYPQKAKSLAVYLAIEEAIVQSISTSKTVTISSMAGLRELDASLFEATISDFRACIVKQASAYKSVAAEAVAEELHMSVSEVLKAYQNGASEKHTIVKSKMENAMTQLAIPHELSAAALRDTSAASLLSLFARCMIGNGLGGHPSAEGHDAQYAAIVDALKAEHQETAFLHVYEVGVGSTYLALGDANAYGAAADGLAQRLHAATQGSVAYHNLTAKDQTAAMLLEKLPAYTQQIQQADLISLGFSPNVMNQFVVQQLKAKIANRQPAPMDWSGLLGDTYAETIEETVDAVKEELKEAVGIGNVMGMDIGDVMTLVIESYAFSYIEHMVSYYNLCREIHTINPKVQILTVGMYNPLGGVALKANDTVLDAGEYMQMLISLINFVYLCAGATTETCTYVITPEAKTAAKPMTHEIVPFIMGLLTSGADQYEMDPKCNAHIEERLWDSLVVTKRIGPSSITSDVYTIGTATVSKISAGTTVAAFLDGIGESDYVKIYQNGKEVSPKTKLGTGMQICLEVGGKTVQALTALITGDTNGDGAISVTDMLAVKADVLNKTKLSGAGHTAGDTNGDGNITITDFIQIKAQILGKSEIKPR
jgi:lysophospholipase L1-like esterase